MDEVENGSKRARMLARIMVVIIVLAVNVACVGAILSLVESRTATPDIYMVDFGYTNKRDGATYVYVVGTVINPSSLPANNVTVIISVYEKYLVPPLNTSIVDLGRIPPDSSKSFNADVLYSGDYYHLDGVDYGLLLGSRFDFGADFFAIALPMAVLLPVLDVYCAYKLGFFGWIKARKKVVATTVAWSVSIAFVVVLSYWLFYSSGRGGTGFSTVFGQSPKLDDWVWVFIFVVSIVVGAIIVSLDAVVYSFVASWILSLIFEVLYGSFFVWFSLGAGESFSIIIPGLRFSTFLQSVVGGVFLTSVRMTNVTVPLFCLLGVFIGAFARSYFEPSVDAI